LGEYFFGWILLARQHYFGVGLFEKNLCLALASEEFSSKISVKDC